MQTTYILSHAVVVRAQTSIKMKCPCIQKKI